MTTFTRVYMNIRTIVARHTRIQNIIITLENKIWFFFVFSSMRLKIEVIFGTTSTSLLPCHLNISKMHCPRLVSISGSVDHHISIEAI